MPVYTYECPKCKSHVEITAKITETRATPTCTHKDCDGNQEMRSVLSAPALQFRGSGWTPKYHR